MATLMALWLSLSSPAPEGAQWVCRLVRSYDVECSCERLYWECTWTNEAQGGK